MLCHVCLWLHGPPQLPLAARTATLSLRVSPPHCHLQAHQVPLPWQVEGGTPGSRDATAHAGTAETALMASVSRAGPSRGGETAVPCSPSAPERVAEASCAVAGGTLPHQGCLWRVTCCVCPRVVSEPTCLSAVLSGSQHQGWERGCSHDGPSLPLTGERGTWQHQPGQAVGRAGGSPVGLRLVARGPLLCSQHWHPGPELVLGRAEGCSEGRGAR